MTRGGTGRWAGIALAVVVVTAAVPSRAPAAPARHWLAPVEIGGAAPVEGLPAVAMTPTGEAVLAWARGGPDPAVLVSARPPGTSAWPAPTRVSAPCSRPVGCLHYSVSVVTNAAGAVCVGWVEGSGAHGINHAVIGTAERPAGAAGFAPAQAVAELADLLFGMSLGMDGTGALTAVWNERGGRALAAGHPPGGAWSAPRVISSEGERTSASLVAVGGGGDALATWVRFPSCVPVAARRRDGAWEAPLALDAAPQVCPGRVEPMVAGGEALAVWDGRADADPVVLWAAVGDAAGAWSAPQPLGIGDGLPLVSPPRLSAGPAGPVRATWRADDGTVLTGVRSAGAWSATEQVPGLRIPSGVAPASTVGGDGSAVVAVATDGAQPTRAVVAGPDGRFDRPRDIGRARPAGDSPPALAADVAGEAVAAWRRGTGLVAADLTARPGAGLALPGATITRLRGPARVPRGSLARLVATATSPAGTQLVAVERRVGRRWRSLTRSVIAGHGVASVAVRLMRAGTVRLRVRPIRPAGPPSPAITVRVTRPGLRHTAVGAGPVGIAVGEDAAWVLGDGGTGAALRRLDPATGRVAGPAILLGGEPTSITAGAGAVWVVRDRREVLRLDPSSGAVTATRRFCEGARVIAGPEGVWVAGACVPGEPSVDPTFRAPTVAYRVDPATIAPVGAPIRFPDTRIEGGALAGGVLWLSGRDTLGFGGSTALRVDPRTGAIVGGGGGGYSGSGVLTPVSGREAWVARGRRITAIAPGRFRVIAPNTRVGASVVLAAAGRRVWALDSRTRRGGSVVRRLISFDRSGARRGPRLAVGVSPPGPASVRPAVGLALGAGAAWVLLPGQGAVVRVPLPR